MMCAFDPAKLLGDKPVSYTHLDVYKRQKPGRPRGSFLLLGPTGVGKTETVIVTTNQIFGPGQLFRFDMSEFQNQESLGLLLGARLGEVGYLGGVRERCLLYTSRCV